ncbi:rhomboid family intramembrane serine protease [Candidatus Pacearchaeota archaeon]|nr:rhomboid family intramembrane serine protease [Candidatus Pacearchaeota archaeon]
MKYYSFKIAAILIIVFLLQLLIPAFTDFLVIDNSMPFEIWRYFTAIFLHGGLLHLVLNLFGLVFFGFILEHEIKPKKFLLVFLTAGIFSSIISVFFYSKVLGASGAIFGIIGTLVILRPSMTVWAYSVPMPLFLASLLWALADIFGVFFPTGIANLGHLSGLFVGILIGFYLRAKMPKIKTNKEKINIPEEYVIDWEKRYMG